MAKKTAKVLTIKQHDKVCELATAAYVPDSFNPFDVKAVKDELRKEKASVKNLEKILAIIAPEKKA